MGSSEGPGSNMCCVKYWDEISKPPDDDRKYRAIELSNGMRILLISDPDTDQAAAAVDINVGSLYDPDEVPGLAHFCEHMVSVGTEKYPDPKEFPKYVNMYGGNHHASTFLDHTVYHFDINASFLDGALDRFAQFFISPLFPENCIEREVESIQNEFEAISVIDTRKLDQYDKHTSKPGHAYAKFGNGTTDTLINIPRQKGINIIEEVKKFYDKWYSSNIMTAAIIGKNDVNELEKMATIYFRHVRNKNVEPLEWSDPPFGLQESKVIGYIVPNQDIQTLTISFPAPDFEPYYRTKPYHYISNLFSREGGGGLSAALRKRGWCEKLMSGAKIGGRGFGFFFVKIDLTDKGIEHIYDIVTLFFQYTKMLDSEGPQKWIFDEYRAMLEVTYRFKEKEPPANDVTTLSRRLQQYPIEEVIKAPYMADRWDPYLIQTVMQTVVPAKVRLAVLSKKFEEVTDKTEPWFGTNYKIEKIPFDKIQEWENSDYNPEFRLPERNCFIPRSLEIEPVEEDHTHPIIIEENSLIRLWYKQDVTFSLPRTSLYLDIQSPFAYIDPFTCALTRFFTQALECTLDNVTCAATAAGQEWKIKNTEYGISISIEGYSDRQYALLDCILTNMMSMRITPSQFNIVKDNFVKSLDHFDKQQPFEQTTYYLGVLMSDCGWTKGELLEAAEELTLKHLKEFIPQLLSKIFVECFVCGNTSRDRARQIIYVLNTRFQQMQTTKPLVPHLRLRRRETKLPNGSNFVYEVPNKYNSTSCAEVYFQCNSHSVQNNAIIELLVHLMVHPAAAILGDNRKPESRVLCSVRRSSSFQGFKIVVQGDEHPQYLEQNIAGFLVKIREHLANMAIFKFEILKETLISLALRSPRTLASVAMTHWKEILIQQYHFNRAEEEVAYMRTITIQQILEYFDTYVRFGGPQRRKISVHMMPQLENGETLPPPSAESLDSYINENQLPPLVQPNVIKDITVFRSLCELNPLIEPYANLSTFMSISPS